MFRASGNLRSFSNLARDIGSWEERAQDKEIWREPENRRNAREKQPAKEGRLEY